MTARALLDLARAELGTVEYPPNSNKVKYNTAYYGREVAGSEYAWCAVFLWWLFREAGASRLYYGGQKTAYCPALMSYHMSRAQGVTDYRPGDIIFFNFNGKSNAQHVGICESWDGENVTTIDGNTGTGNEANGGAVMRRTRDRKYIVGAYRPDYTEDTMDEEMIRTIVRQELERQAAAVAALPSSEWARVRLAEAVEAGITDGSRPQAPATRQEVAMMVLAAIE